MYIAQTLILPMKQILGFLIILYSTLNAQKITLNETLFVGESTELISIQEGIQKNNLIETTNSIEIFWSKINPNLKKQICFNSAYFEARNLKIKPYLEALLAFSNSDASMKNVTEFDNCIKELVIKKNNNALKKTLDFAVDFNLNKMLAKNPSSWWEYQGVGFSIKNEKSNLIFNFPSLNLILKSNIDSSSIKNTSGSFNFEQNEFTGNGGIVDWTRAGIDNNDCNATLTDYKINTKLASWKAESAALIYKKYFPGITQGYIEDQLSASRVVKPQDYKYPSFVSYESPLVVKNIFPDVDFIGAFNLAGPNVKHMSEKASSQIVFHQNKVPVLRILGKDLSLSKEKIIANAVSAIFYIGNKDSIFNSNLSFKYIDETKEVMLYSNSKSSDGQPWGDNFHDIGLTTDAFYWNTTDTLIHLKAFPNSRASKANFESDNYYRSEKLDAAKEAMGINTIDVLYKCRFGTNSPFTPQEFSKCSGFSIAQCKSMLYELSVLGFVSFDPERNIAEARSKLEHYIRSRAKIVDYDVLEFNSKVDGLEENGKINLKNGNLDLNGVKTVFLSDSQQVYIHPNNGKLRIQENRNFKFNGAIQCGRFDFLGQKIDFNYDKFTLDLKTIDSLKIWIDGTTRTRDGKFKLVDLKTQVKIVRGNLEIDNPNNKSGLKAKKYPEYPIFHNLEPALALYEEGNKQGRVYKSSDFHFDIEPFVIDSLDNFNPKSLRLKGLLVSDSIFPDYKSTLIIQPDFSLGIDEYIEEKNNLPMYGKAKYFGKLNLSNEGFKALDGTIQYLSSKIFSKELILYPDSIKGIAKNIDTKEDASFNQPEMKAEEVKMFWDIKKNQLKFTPNGTMSFYANKSTFSKGDLGMNENGVTATNGLFSLKHGDVFSKKILFKTKTAFTDSALFVVYNPNNSTTYSKDQLISAMNTKIDFDFDKDTAKVVPQSSDSAFYFHSNQYVVSSVNSVKWNFGLGNLEFFGNEPKMKFTSINKEQDSLTFNVGYANYDIKDQIIHCEKTSDIQISDAYITPHKGKLDLLPPDGIVSSMDSATVDIKQEYHNYQIVNAKVDIIDQYHCRSSGKLLYKDAFGNQQLVTVKESYTDSLENTYTALEILDDDTLMLNPYLQYNGAIEIAPYRKNYLFSGGIKTYTTCSNILPSAYINYTGEIDINNIRINFGEQKEEAPSILGFIFQNTDSFRIRMGLLSENTEGKQLINAEAGSWGYDKVLGKMTYNDQFVKNTVTSEIEKKKKKKKKSKDEKEILKEKDALVQKEQERLKKEQKELESKDWREHVEFSFDVKECKGEAKGAIDLHETSPNFDGISAGTITHFSDKDTTNLHLLWALALDANPKLEKYLGKFFEAEAYNLNPVEMNSEHSKFALKHLLSSKKYNKFLKKLNANKSVKLPKTLRSFIGFSDIKMNWDQQNQAFISDGKIGIQNIGSKYFNKYVNGTVVLQKRSDEDLIGIYLEFTSKVWIFMKYADGQLIVTSSSEDFNSNLYNLSQKNSKSSKIDILPTEAYEKDDYINKYKNKITEEK